METLIQITTGEQGSSVVSARKLYAFLEIKQQFSDWIKARIIRYGFREGEDYIEIDGAVTENLVSDENGVFHKTMKNPKGGRNATDYDLTLDMAKELSMVERSDKGKAARLYFIHAEQALRQIVATTPTPPALNSDLLLQLMSQQQSMMAVQTELLQQLRADVDSIKAGNKPIARKRPTLAAPHLRELSSASSLRQSIGQRVNEYCGMHGVTQMETYNYLYKRMYDVCGVNVYRLVRHNNESYLDALERYGHLDRLFGLIMAELTYVEE